MIADRFDPLCPSSLRALKKIVSAGAKANIPVTLCGELGGKPLEAMTLLGLGYRSLSMSPASIGPVKAMLLELEVHELEQEMSDWLNDPKGNWTLRNELQGFAEKHGVPL